VYHANGAPRLGVSLCFDSSEGGGGAATGGEGGGEGGKTGEGENSDPPKTNDADKTLTQAQVNSIVKRRAEELVAKELGVGLDAAKALIAKGTALEETQKTELQKATDKAAKDAREAADKEWEGKLAATQRAADLRLIEAEVRGMAHTAGFHDPEDAWLRVRAQAEGDAPTVKLDDAGKVLGVKEALDKLAKDKPYLVKTGDGTHTPAPPRNGGGGDGPQAKYEQGARELIFGGTRRR